MAFAEEFLEIISWKQWKIIIESEFEILTLQWLWLYEKSKKFYQGYIKRCDKKW